MLNSQNNLQIICAVENFLLYSNPATTCGNLKKIFHLVCSSPDFNELPNEEQDSILKDVTALRFMVNILPQPEAKNAPKIVPVTPVKPPVRLTKKWRKRAKPGTPNIINIVPPGMAG